VPKHIWENEDPETFKNWPPIFTGPFEVVESTPEHYVLKARDDYWGGPFGQQPRMKYIVGEGIGPPEKAMMAFVRNDIDSMGGYILGFKKSQYELIMEENPYCLTWEALDPCVTGSYYPLNQYPWNLTKFRQAINFGINKTQIAWAAWEGITVPAKTPFPDYLGIKKYLFDDVIIKYSIDKYDPDKAKQILDELNFIDRDGDGIRETPNGIKLSMTLILPQGEPREGCMVISDNLAKIGIDMRWKELLWPTVNDCVGRAKGYNMTLGVNLCAPGVAQCWDPYALYESLHSKWAKIYPVGTSAPRPLWTRYNNPELDEIVDTLEQMSPDDPEALPYYKKALEIVLRDLPILPLTQTVYPQVFNTYYWEGWPSEDNVYMQPFPWWPSFKVIVLRLNPTDRTPSGPSQPTEVVREVVPSWVYPVVGVLVIVAVGAIILAYRGKIAK